jgi:hypothetical protein
MIDREGKPTDHYDGSTGYSNCFASWSWDINQDGWDDIIVVGFPGAPFHWYENPQGKDGPWPEHEIWHSACNETPLFTDLTGDGRPEIILGSQPERQMGYLELPGKYECTEKWKFTPISEPGDPNQNGTFMYYHGLGVGDMNLDGRRDVIIPHGWWEAPEDHSQIAAGSGSSEPALWEFHPTLFKKDGEEQPVTASNIYAIDLDLDGDQDVVMSCAHSYGVWWWENQGLDQPYQYHLVDESYSQTHALWMVDLHGDGTPTLVTGKRYFAHQGHDPGGREPVVMYSYEIRRSPGQPPTFARTEIVAGRDTGVGTQFEMNDIDGDHDWDIVLSNKKGVNLLLQK